MNIDRDDPPDSAKMNSLERLKATSRDTKTRQELEEKLYQQAVRSRLVRDVHYDVFIDTFNLFQHAYEALTPLFEVGRSYNEDLKPIKNQPSAAEYAKFSDVFLDYISGSFEERFCSGEPGSISERELRTSIGRLVSGSITQDDVPDPSEIISFSRSIGLFGARFDKEEVISRIDSQIKYSWRSKDLKTEASWQELKRRVIEDDIITLSGSSKRKRTKRYTYYNDFLDHLVELGANPNLPGFYKYFLEDGAFTSHAEKGVDTSLAVASISLAFEKPEHHQVFCVSDTDFLPVFRKLEELGVPFLILHVTKSEKVPREFLHYQRNGILTSLDFESMCSEVIDQFVEMFIHGGEFLYKGENGHIYDLLAKIRWTEMNHEWQDALRAQNHALWEPTADDD